MESTKKPSEPTSKPEEQETVESEMARLEKEIAIAQERLQFKQELLAAIRAGKLPELMAKAKATQEVKPENQTPISEA